ncbi:unnamed protein product [Caenorhabditis nigoni]
MEETTFEDKSKYTFGIIQRVNHIGGLIILSYLRSDQSSLYKLKKPTTRGLHSFHSNRFNSTKIGSMAALPRKDKNGCGWTTRTTRKKIKLHSGASR